MNASADNGVDIATTLPPCPGCGAGHGEHCRTKTVRALMPPCQERLVAEIRHLRQHVTSLQRCNTDYVLWIRELEAGLGRYAEAKEGYGETAESPSAAGPRKCVDCDVTPLPGLVTYQYHGIKPLCENCYVVRKSGFAAEEAQ